MESHGGQNTGRISKPQSLLLFVINVFMDDIIQYAVSLLTCQAESFEELNNL